MPCNFVAHNKHPHSSWQQACALTVVVVSTECYSSLEYSLTLQCSHAIEPQNRTQQHLRTIGTILRTRKLKRIVADSISTRSENHACRHSLVRIDTVMSRAARHHLAPRTKVAIFQLGIAKQILASLCHALDAVFVEVRGGRNKVSLPFDAAISV